MKVNCFVAHTSGGLLEHFQYTSKPLGSYDIGIEITHCGFCRSDIHLVDNDWGISNYPLVPGHEIIGKVVDLGELVSHLKKGDRVGVGWQHSSCLTCGMCSDGHENICSNNKATCVGNYGGFADFIIADSRFAYLIPEELPSESAAPLMCAGSTMYSPLKRLNMNEGKRVGIIGMGGLGHLGIKFAKALGCEVYSFSETSSKSEKSKEMGADYFIHSKNAKEMKEVKGSLDCIISTTPASINWSGYIDILRPNGVLCLTGVPQNNIDIPSVMLMSTQKSIQGSTICNRKNMQEMLLFAAKHKIKPEIVIMPLSECNDALQFFRKNHPSYRIVFEVNKKK